MNSTTQQVIAPGHVDHPPYNYVPTLWICAIFIALYGISGLLHLAQAIRTRLWWMIPTAVLANIGEVIGWSGRLWSSKNPTLLNPFLMQITTTIISPTPLVAANFIILGQLIVRLGPRYSRLSAILYAVVFCSFDGIALIVQAVGGAKATDAAKANTDPVLGGNIMLGGIAFQLAAITVYVALAAEFVLRFLADRPIHKTGRPSGGPRTLDTRTKLMLCALSFSSLTIFIRSVYRTIELSNGWNGYIISTERYFNVLDGAMIVLATYTLNVFHPGVLLGHGDTWRSSMAQSNDSTSVITVTENAESVSEKEPKAQV